MSTTTATGDRWERTGAQARSHRTQDAFLDAAEELFGRDGVAQTSVTDVADRAGRSIGSLYHHFTNKETLVAAVVDRILASLESTADRAIDPARWAGADITQIVRSYAASSLELGGQRPGSKRIIVEVSLTDDVTRERYRRFREHLEDGLTALLIDRSDEIGHPDPPLAARFVIDQLTAMLTARLDGDTIPTQLAERADRAFVDEAVSSVGSYLRLADDA